MCLLPNTARVPPMDYRHKTLPGGPFWTPMRGPFCAPIDTHPADYEYALNGRMP